MGFVGLQQAVPELDSSLGPATYENPKPEINDAPPSSPASLGALYSSRPPPGSWLKASSWSHHSGS